MTQITPLLLLVLLITSCSPPPAYAQDSSQYGLLAIVSLTSSGHYVARLDIGSPPQPEPLLLDLAENYVSVQCGTVGPAFVPARSSSFHPVTRGGKPVYVSTPISHSGLRMVVDSLTLNVTNGINPGMEDTEVKNVHFLCSSSAPSQTETGVAGLGRGKLALPSMLASLRKLPRRFAYCLSGSNYPTPLFFGSSNYTLLPGLQLSNLLHTPLLRQTKRKPGYSIALKSINISGTHVSIDPKVFRGGLEVSTIEPYTKLVRPAYIALRDAFRVAHNGIPRVPAPSPFDTCFNASGLGSTRVGPPVNPIIFVLGDDATPWYFYGGNSMVFVSDNVMCLGFLDAGPAPAHSVLGTYQQLDSFVEVDLDKKQLSFYSTLSFIRTTCADFNFTRGDF